MAAAPIEKTAMVSSVLASASNSETYSQVHADELPLLTKGEKKNTSHEDGVTRRSAEEMKKALNEMERKYAAYVRDDTYGTMGTGDISLREKAALVLALLVLVPIKVVLLFIIVFTYYLICKLCTMGCLTNQKRIEQGNGDSSANGYIMEERNGDSTVAPLNGGSAKSDGHIDPSVAMPSPKHDEGYAHLTGLRRVIIVHSGRFLSRAILFVLGFFWIKVTRRDKECVAKDGQVANEMDLHSSALVSNHVSYVDILYHMSASFPSFVAKRSVARLPLIGLISKCLGCVYVQREDKPSDFKGVAGIISERLRAAARDKKAPRMMLFPEGTTTNGNYLLPFKTGAFVAGTPVQPVILRYPYRRFSPAWDTISGVRHVVLLLCQFVNHLEVVWLPIYVPSEKEKSDPKLYASNVRKLMAVEGHLTEVDIGLQEKRIYHSFLNDYLSSNASE